MGKQRCVRQILLSPFWWKHINLESLKDIVLYLSGCSTSLSCRHLLSCWYWWIFEKLIVLDKSPTNIASAIHSLDSSRANGIKSLPKGIDYLSRRPYPYLLQSEKYTWKISSWLIEKKNPNKGSFGLINWNLFSMRSFQHPLRRWKSCAKILIINGINLL